MTQLYGLVLAGGKSERMGLDKGRIKWHGKEQRFWMADLLKKFCADVFISCTPEQVDEIKQHSYKAIKDESDATGPLGAVVSAYHAVARVAWLVVACDLPLLDAEAIRHLIGHRDANSIATAYKNPGDQLPDPLVAIWEPHAALLLEAALKENKFSLRQILVQQNILGICAGKPDSLINVNCPGDAQAVTERKYFLKGRS